MKCAAWDTLVDFQNERFLQLQKRRVDGMSQVDSNAPKGHGILSLIFPTIGAIYSQLDVHIEKFNVVSPLVVSHAQNAVGMPMSHLAQGILHCQDCPATMDDVQFTV